MILRPHTIELRVDRLARGWSLAWVAAPGARSDRPRGNAVYFVCFSFEAAVAHSAGTSTIVNFFFVLMSALHPFKRSHP